MKTRSERFVEAKKDNWKALRLTLEKISKKGMKKLSAREIEAFPGLYRQTCQDLAEARMLRLSPDVLAYLNNLTGQAHYHLYFVKPLTLQNLSRFLKVLLPQAIVRSYIPVLLAFFLFWGTAAGSYMAVLAQPDRAEKVINPSMLHYLEDMYRESAATGRTGGERAQMSAFYIQHNTSIAFLCFATGVFLGLGSIYFLVYNGVFLGSLAAYLTARGLGDHLWEFVTAHAFLELNAIAIAGGAGMLLGYAILRSWKEYSSDALRGRRENILLLVAAAAVMLFLAALIEGNISPSVLDYSVKVATAVVSGLLFGAYFILLPLRRREGL